MFSLCENEEKSLTFYINRLSFIDMMYMKYFLFGFLLLAGIQKSSSQIKILTDDDFFNQKHASLNTIELKIINNTILVPVQLKGGLRVYFILDTGVTNPIITDPMIVNLLGIEYERSYELTGYGTDRPILAHVGNNFEYSIGAYPESFTGQVIYLDQALHIDELLGEPVYGIIGYSFFNNFHVKLDFSREKMIIKKPNQTYKYGKKYKKIPLEIIGNKPFIQVETENNEATDSLKLLIDTGFTGAMNLYPQNEHILATEEPNIPNYLGIGLNGLVTSTMFKVDELNLNSQFQLPSVSTNLIDSTSLINTSIQNYSDGSLGIEVLRRFIVVFDYSNKMMFLRKKSSQFNDEFLYNASGIRIREDFDRSNNRMIKITHLREASNAKQIGLLEDDEIIEIDGRNVSGQKIESIYERLNNFDEPNRSILVNRNDSTRMYQFIINNEVPWN